jgi:Phytanoyl-CoA dioxygenase (PhyH)
VPLIVLVNNIASVYANQHRELEQRGCFLYQRLLDEDAVNHWLEQCETAFKSQDSGMLRSRGSLYGSRSLLRVLPATAELALRGGLLRFIDEALGSGWGVVRGLFFDKPPDRSWTLPWHRDRTIAVSSHEHVEHFTNPTVKAGIPHMIAPQWLLERMLTLRVHLDEVTNENGPLVVLPGSHRCEQADEELAMVSERSMLPILCQAGDVFVMRPLLAHTSLLSTPGTLRHRRVIHLELAPSNLLPAPLRWHDFIN